MVLGPATEMESSLKEHNTDHTYNYNHYYEARDENWEASSLALLIEHLKHKEIMSQTKEPQPNKLLQQPNLTK